MSGHIDMDEKKQLDRLEQMFFAALEQPEDRRADFLEQACGSDVQFRTAVEAMLSADLDRAGLIDTAPWSAPQVARRLASGEDEDPLIQPGSRIRRYELVEFLGAGGMGAVWLAERTDGGFDQRVALKLIKRGLDTDEVLRRFRRERQVLAQLEHPNIARLIDGGATEDGRPYLVMEYVVGRPIDDWCDQRRLGIRERLQLFLSVCEAVQYAHSKLTVHRDIKPGNILITDDGQPKLLDFGLAKLLRDDGSPESLLVTAAGQRMLTPRYASPEQVRGEPVSTASDVYSLGVLLYELLAGHSPYHVKNRPQRDIEHAVTQIDPVRPSAVGMSHGRQPDDMPDSGSICERRSTTESALRRVIRGDLDTIILKALAKAPAERYGTVAALADDLQRHLDAKPIAAAPESATAIMRKFVRRNKTFAVAVVVSISVLIGATAVSLSYAAGESQARTEAERRTRIAESINAFINEDLLSSVDPQDNNNPNLTVREALDRAAERIGDRFDGQPLVEASIRHTIGATYRGLRRPGQSVPHLQRAVELREDVLGKLHKETRQAMRDLVAGLYESDQGKDGFTLGEALLPLDIAAVGSDSADAMDTRHLLAQYDDGDGDGDEDIEPGITMLRSILEWNRSNRGVAHRETLSVMHTLANTYVYNHRIEEAAPLIEEIWDVASAHYEPSAPETLDAMLGLAILYGRTDRVEEAVTVLQEAVQILRDTRPRIFADTGIWLTHLGNHLQALDRNEEAETAYLDAYEILSESLGTEIHWTQGTVHFLCEIYKKAEDPEKTAQWCGRLLPQFERGW